jgi:CubicO group peptidase (beta-lactamase class C family)
MSASGLSKGRLRHMSDVLTRYVERRQIPGLVTLINRRGDVYIDAVGMKAFDADDRMTRDTIFRITSMTKPVTAAAAMILVEECRLRLDEPVDRLLPELANRRVLRRIDSALNDTVPAVRPITVRDLLTCVMGFGVIPQPSNHYPIYRAISELGIMTVAPTQPPVSLPPDEWIRRLGTLPLMHHPGERWMYNTSSYVLGILIARAAGVSFEKFLTERIFEPLGMKDTAFNVPAEKLGRLATCYGTDAATGKLRVVDGPLDSGWASPPIFHSGGGGLVSTVDDYLAFGEMMLSGRCQSGRLLARPTVQLMTADQLTTSQKVDSPFSADFWRKYGWGFGVSTIKLCDGIGPSVGSFGWDGAFGTCWCSDPKEELVAILMMQRVLTPFVEDIEIDFFTLAYQAIDD